MAKAAVVEENTALQKVKEPGKKLGDFLGDVRSEMRKVSTPSTAETRTTTAVVIVTVFAFAAYFWIVDFGINHSLNALITKLTQH
ncbi:preprotein translocase subunit SecE [Terriglobus roseus]|uniref:Protein translocase subunit SecE n=1 Tax=Terriglobus roseus TaxID=392734 RepID=A0A1G7MMH1_9BACT|nr:preprotein translocase subunit SecE [Terriglobus roseus]SDF62884.1 preprotein translocase subunit SecE [Terriglobus roseus]